MDGQIASYIDDQIVEWPEMYGHRIELIVLLKDYRKPYLLETCVCKLTGLPCWCLADWTHYKPFIFRASTVVFFSSVFSHVMHVACLRKRVKLGSHISRDHTNIRVDKEKKTATSGNVFQSSGMLASWKWGAALVPSAHTHTHIHRA